MLHGASLVDPTLAFPPYNPYATPPLSNPEPLLPRSGGVHPCSPNHLSPAASSAAVAALTAAVAVSAGIPPNVKDSRWLTLEVCRQYQRNQCSRDENECKFAHPPTHVDVQNGRVVCCYDSIKGKCQRRDPPCKYLHPPQHLREQLMENGRNNMIFRNMQLQLFQQQLLVQSSGLFPFGSTPCNSVTSNSLNGSTSPNSILYAGQGPLAIGNPSAQTFLNMGFAPYLTALAGSNMNTAFTEVISPDTNLHKPRTDSKLYGGARQNGVHRSNESKTDTHETPQCIVVVTGETAMKELNHPITIRSTVGNSLTSPGLYAIQPSVAAPGAAVLSQAPQSITAASLAAVVNGTGTLAPGHYPALPEHTAYFRPTYHIEIPPYPYQ